MKLILRIDPADGTGAFTATEEDVGDIDERIDEVIGRFKGFVHVRLLKIVFEPEDLGVDASIEVEVDWGEVSKDHLKTVMDFFARDLEDAVEDLENRGVTIQEMEYGT